MLRDERRAAFQREPAAKKLAITLRKQFEAILAPRAIAKYQDMAVREEAWKGVSDPLVLCGIGATDAQRDAVMRIRSEQLQDDLERQRIMGQKMLDVLTPAERGASLPPKSRRRTRDNGMNARRQPPARWFMGHRNYNYDYDRDYDNYRRNGFRWRTLPVVSHRRKTRYRTKGPALPVPDKSPAKRVPNAQKDSTATVAESSLGGEEGRRIRPSSQIMVMGGLHSA